MSGGDAPAGRAGNGAGDPAGDRTAGGTGNGAGSRSREPGPRLPRREGPVRFSFLDLAYGCHHRRVEFPDRGTPFVILGPNGAGKSTLVEAAVRALYGFNRQRKDDRELYEARRPWSGEAYRATLGLEGPFGRVRVDRDFETDEVVVRGEGTPLYEGEANPAASGREARAYRDLLERLLGLAELEAYQRTACLRQGELIRTRLSEDLLQLAAGGHADVEEARQAIREEHYALTREPAGEGESRRRKPGEIERLRDRASALEERLAEAREAEERRRPLVEERDAVEARLAEVGDQTRRLREAFRGLSELEKLDARREASRGRIRRLEEAHRELDEAIARVDLLEERSEPSPPAYPPDFLERVAALEEGLWPRRARLAEEAERQAAALDGLGSTSAAWVVGPAVAAAGLGLAAAVAFAAGEPLAGGIALLVGVALGGWAAWRRVARARRRTALEAARVATREELDRVEERIRRRLSGIPDAGTLGPGTLPDRRREFERQRREARTREDARGGLRGAMDRARAALAEVEDVRAESEGAAAGPPPGPGDAAGAGGESLLRRGRELLARLAEAVREERNERLAPLQLELRQVSRAQFSLPDGVRPDVEAVDAALAAAAEEERTLRDRLDGLLRRLAYEARPEESPVALRARLREAGQRLARLEARAVAYRHAFRLVANAYDEFRRTDQERLLDGVSAHLRRATGGELGPVKAGRGQLEEAGVESGGRTLSLASPPLSYGQLHSVLFAVRLGASDFLAGFGVRLPLIVDDPFVHLDAGRAGELWDALARIAAERQVVVATQDRLLIEHLRVEPDLELV